MIPCSLRMFSLAAAVGAGGGKVASVAADAAQLVAVARFSVAGIGSIRVGVFRPVLLRLANEYRRQERRDETIFWRAET